MTSSPPQQSAQTPDQFQALRALLHWYVDMGVSDTSGETSSDMFEWGPAEPFLQKSIANAPQNSKQPASTARNSYSQSTRQSPQPPPRKAPPPPEIPKNTGGVPISGEAHIRADEAAAKAFEIANAADTIESLREAIKNADLCSLKTGARHTVLDEGISGAPLMILGEAPGTEEDREGKPFVGQSGQLLDKMLAAIGHSREENTYLTNTIFWRPPGNRSPTKQEVAVCIPFIVRMIELSKPKVLLMMGNTPTQALFAGTPSIIRARGTWKILVLSDGTEIPALPAFHPSHLLRQPAQKRLMWEDLKSLKATIAK